METTGAGLYIAPRLAGAAENLGPLAVLAGFYLLTVALTQPMSNQAAALVVLPLAMITARELDLNPRAFAAAITLAASCSFITPLEPASLLVYGPGRYRFRDYFVVGLPLTLLVCALNLFMVPRIWPLRGPAETSQQVSEVLRVSPRAEVSIRRSRASGTGQAEGREPPAPPRASAADRRPPRS
jgi:di/tricarboxylate transporter